jgi:hypothetical protein
MTLEASLIIPMVICTFVLLIYFSYYLYGRCVLSQDTYVLAFRATRAGDGKSGRDMSSYVSAKADEQLGSKYFGSTKPEVKSSVSGKNIMVSGSAQVRHSAMPGYFLMQRRGWGYKAAGKAKRREYAKHIRQFTRIKDIGKEILDFDTGED